jgi:hypothetical protein
MRIRRTAVVDGGSGADDSGKETTMKNWPRFLRFLWEEEAASSPTPATESRREPTGVPALLRKATRWSAMAVVGAALIGQIIGVRLVARVDADTDYQLICRNNCLAARTTCLKTKSLTTCQSEYNRCLANCAANPSPTP